MMINGEYVPDVAVVSTLTSLSTENAQCTRTLRIYRDALSDALAAILEGDKTAAVTFIQDALKAPKSIVTTDEPVSMLLKRQAG